jgi:serine/threonine protein phosphatase 1
MLPRFLLRRSLTGRDRAVPGPLPRPAPPVCVVGDVHGCLDLLDRLLELVAQHRAAPGGGATAVRLIFAGDMIDRGPASAAVLARVQALCAARPTQDLAPDPALPLALALMGNHERMLLDFLDAPETAGPLWLANGGDATLASFGLNPHRPGDLSALAGALRAALPPGQEAWLRGLPLYWREGDLAVSHAGADPARPIEDQTDAALLWGHRDFRREPRQDGLWIAHGHVIAPAVRAEGGRIGTDTGAFATGRLSAAWLDAGGMTVIEAQRP